MIASVGRGFINLAGAPLNLNDYLDAASKFCVFAEGMGALSKVESHIQFQAGFIFLSKTNRSQWPWSTMNKALFCVFLYSEWSLFKV